MSRIFDCAFDRWAPVIGDPTVMGWVTVAAYALAAVLAFRVASLPACRGREQAFWVLSGAGLAFLSVNKELDLQSLMTAVGRCAARLQGWYDVRRTVQVEAIEALILSCLLAGLIAAWLLRRTLGRTWLALLGLSWIAIFVLVRATGFHHVDALIGLRVAGIRLNWAFELGGIALFALGTVLARRRPTGR